MKLLNKQYRLISFLLFSSFFAMTILLTSNIMFATILLRVDTLSEILYFINNLPVLDNVFIVRLALNVSDMSFTFIKLVSSISLVSVITLGFLLLAFDFSKYDITISSLRKYLLIPLLITFTKYLIYAILLIVNYSTFMSPVPLFNLVGIISLTFDILFIFSYMFIVVKYVDFVRK